jgi:DNA topoisomerase-1
VAETVPQTGEKCENCGKPMVVKNGKRGPFLACTGYPQCKTARPVPEGMKAATSGAGPGAAGGVGAGNAVGFARPARPQPIPTDEKCENCGKNMVLRQGPRGLFLGCSGYPKCKTARNATPEIIEKYQKTE